MPALGGSLADDIEDLLYIEVGTQTEGNGFGQALHHTGHADLIDHLGQLTVAAGAHIGEGAREGVGHGGNLIEYLLIAAAHDGELAVDRTGLTARYRGIDKVQAALAGLGIQLASHLRRGRGVIDKDGPRLHARKGAVVAQHNGAQVVIIAHAGEDHACALDGFAGRGRMAAARKLFGPGFGLGRRAVVDRDLMASRSQVPGHGVAHDTQAQKGHRRGSAGCVAAGGDGGCAHEIL